MKEELDVVLQEIKTEKLQALTEYTMKFGRQKTS